MALPRTYYSTLKSIFPISMFLFIEAEATLSLKRYRIHVLASPLLELTNDFNFPAKRNCILPAITWPIIV